MSKLTSEMLPGASRGSFHAVARSYFLWSVKWQKGEDMVFWGPNSAGYYTSVEEAGRYSANEAYDITRGSNSKGVGLLIHRKADYLRFRATLLKHQNDVHTVAIPTALLSDILTIRRVAKI